MALRPVITLALLCALVTASASARNAPHVPRPALPNHGLTPGARFAVGKAKVCKTGYSARVRNVSESKKDLARRTGLTTSCTRSSALGGCRPVASPV
jgi:hypothetical protein